MGWVLSISIWFWCIRDADLVEMWVRSKEIAEWSVFCFLTTVHALKKFRRRTGRTSSVEQNRWRNWTLHVKALQYTFYIRKVHASSEFRRHGRRTDCMYIESSVVVAGQKYLTTPIIQFLVVDVYIPWFYVTFANRFWLTKDAPFF